jgi:hypothetical protein
VAVARTGGPATFAVGRVIATPSRGIITAGGAGVVAAEASRGTRCGATSASDTVATGTAVSRNIASPITALDIAALPGTRISPDADTCVRVSAVIARLTVGFSPSTEDLKVGRADSVAAVGAGWRDWQCDAPTRESTRCSQQPTRTKTAS